MINDLTHYRLFAAVLRFPRGALAKHAAILQEYLHAHYPGAAEQLQPFTDYAGVAVQDVMEELYTRTFDVQAVTTLDVGYILFGDDYKRGELLSNLNREHVQVKNDCCNELADYLPNILTLMPQLQDVPLIEELVEEMLAPAVRKMISEFDPGRIEQKNRVFKKHYKTVLVTSPEYARIYLRPLQALYSVLRQDFALVERDEPLPTGEFLKSVRTELELENTDQPHTQTPEMETP